MTTPLPSNLDSLLELARREGIDVRPTLLRVLTDLYVQKPSHSPEEEQQFTELAIRLVDAVDLATRKAIADRLLRYPGAPLTVLKRLATDFAAMAKLDSKAIAPPPKVPAQTAAQIAPPVFVRAPAREPIRPPATIVPPPRRPAEPRPALSPAQASHRLVERFFVGNANERRSLLSRLARSSAQAAPPRPLLSATIAEMEHQVLGGRPDLFIRSLENALQIDRKTAERIVNDVSGETMVVAAKALSIPLDVLQRILLFLNPAIGHSVERMYALSALYDDLRREAALRMAAALRGAFADALEDAAPASHSAPRRQPVLFDDERHRVRRAEPVRRDGAEPDRTRAPAAAKNQRTT